MLGIFVGAIFISKIPDKIADDKKILSTSTVASPSSSSIQSEKGSAAWQATLKVTKVIDGDTVVIGSGETVRYIGIDSPEKNDCFASEATNENKNLVLGKEVILEKDVSETDRYGRILRLVYIGDILVNDYLVRQGFAKAYRYPPDVKFSDQFGQAEQEARDNNRGLWSICELGQTDHASPSPTTKLTTQYFGGDKDCKDFKTHAEAQAFFESAGPGDPHRLDSNGNGLACESLP